MAQTSLRPTPLQSLTISGFFDERLASTLLFQIEQLRAQSNDSLTVYINSNGGSIKHLRQVLNSLRSIDINGNKSDFNTVVLGEASSAAAIFLTLGNYALAYPHSEIHFHGVRYEEVVDLDKEKASSLAAALNQRNQEVSHEMAESAIKRLIHRLSLLTPDLKRTNPRNNQPNAQTFYDFTTHLQSRLSKPGADLLEETFELTHKALTLYETAFQKPVIHRSPLRKNIAILRNIFKSKIRNGWQPNEQGLQELTSDYLLLRDYLDGSNNQTLNWVTETFGRAFLTPQELKTLDAQTIKPNGETANINAAPRILPFWYFTVCLCRKLLTKENRLTASDAYWLGIIDEVIGTDMTGYRPLLEAQTPGEASQMTLPWASEVVRSSLNPHRRLSREQKSPPAKNA